MANKKICLTIIILLTTLFLFGTTGANSTYAYSINVNLDTNQITSGLPTQVTDLINAAKQFWQNFSGGAAPTPISGITSPVNLQKSLENTNTWLVNTTGLNFTQIVKAVGGFVAWVLSLAADLIKQGLSLIK